MAFKLGNGWSRRVLKHMLEVRPFCEVSDKYEERVIENWRKSYLCYKVAKNLTGLCSSILWKVELLSNEIGYFAKQIHSSIERTTWL